MSDYAPPLGFANYRHFQVPDEWMDIGIEHIIGRNGRNFIQATHRSRCKYIWFDNNNRRIEVWGPHHRVVDGEKAVKDIAARILNNASRGDDRETRSVEG